jgi:methylated-DNA-[protein]-cysteine S-methyltransferase
VPQLSLHTPAGDLTISEEADQIVALDWGWGRDQTPTPLLIEAREELFAYFDGTRTAFELPLAPAGSPFQKRVWQALCHIPFGQTRTYAQIATEIASVPRAVGQASAANPIPIFIPCHRVLAANGIGGYSGGDGLTTKRLLLDLETRRRQQ